MYLSGLTLGPTLEREIFGLGGKPDETLHGDVVSKGSDVWKVNLFQRKEV